MSPTNDIEHLYRYLRATRRRCLFVEDQLSENLSLFTKRAFPGATAECIFVPIRSDSRRCEFRVYGSALFVVIDLALSDRLMELDLLAQIARPGGDWILTFSTALLGDVFRQRRDLRRYRYCVLKARGDVATLEKLAMLPKGGGPFHAAIVPVVLHEVAHIAYRNNEGFIKGLRDLAESALEKFAFATAEQAQTGRYPVDAGQTLGVPFEQYDQERLKLQLEAYTAMIRGNPELLEEVTCDFTSALAFVNSEAGIDCFEDLVPASLPLSRRQLGDVFYLTIKASRYLQFLQGLQQFGTDLVSNREALSRSMIEMTARTNALTFLLTSIFDLQMDRTTFEEKPDFGKPLQPEQIKDVFGNSIAQLMRLQHEQLLEPFDLLMELFLDPIRFERDEADVLAAYSGPVPETIDAVDDIRAVLPI
jgi:hypothetical protein